MLKLIEALAARLTTGQLAALADPAVAHLAALIDTGAQGTPRCERSRNQ